MSACDRLYFVCQLYDLSIYIHSRCYIDISLIKRQDLYFICLNVVQPVTIAEVTLSNFLG